MNKLKTLFETKKSNILNIYFTAGFPKLTDTGKIIMALEKSGADIIEIGMPYSDPVADGETIQESNQVALENGMSIKVLFQQLIEIKEQVNIPIILMGYINPVLQFGVENFCKKCQEAGVSGLILPDLPIEEYINEYKAIFEKYGIYNTFLITPQTTEARIQLIDQASESFIYMVSSASITGATSGISPQMETYFNRVNAMNLNNPRLIGFGIKDKTSFNKACEYASGAIIGSQFIRVLQGEGNMEENIDRFVKEVRG